jgi:hypothetical protein
MAERSTVSVSAAGAFRAARRSCASGGVLVAALWSVVLPSVADAARPTENTQYRGRTSQGNRINLLVGRANVLDEAETNVRVACRQAGRLRYLALAFVLPVRRDGSFSSTEYYGQDPDFARVTRGGAAGLDFVKQSFRGQFASPRRVSGTLRVQAMIIVPASFPDSPQLLDTCDSGVVRWTARKFRRVATPASPQEPSFTG